MKKHLNKILLTAVLALAGLMTGLWSHRTASISDAIVSPVLSVSMPPGYVLVARAVDGDTIELADGTKVRLLGIDTPETVDPRKPVQCFGPEASARTHTLVDGRPVRLVRDVENTDRYGRLLRYVYLQDGTFVNLSLVSDGYARAYRYPPNVAHADQIKAAQTTARLAGLGLWGACPAVAK